MSTKSETKRHRFKNSVETNQVDIDNVLGNYTETITTNVTWSDTETVSGADDPKWKSKVRNRGNATNTVSATRARFTTINPCRASVLTLRKRLDGNPPGRIVYRKTDKKWVTLITFTKPSPGTHLPEASANARRAFVSKARQTLSPANLGVTFGELNETLRMMTRPGRAIVNGMGSYLRTVNKYLRRNTRFPKRKKQEIVSDTWLEYSFGWAPLVADTQDLAKAAAQLASGIEGQIIRKTGTAETQQSSSSGQVSFPAAGAINYDVLNKTTTHVTVYGKINHNLAAPGNFDTRFGLQLNNWLPTLWELVPWSFAIDYFTTVGDYISSMCFPLSQFQYTGQSSRTIVQRKSANYRIVGDTKFSSTNLEISTSFSPGQTIAEVETFDRIRPVDLTSPVSFSLPASKFAYVNLSALANLRYQQYRRSL